VSFHDSMSLKDARDLLRPQAMNGGGMCPCCGQRAQVYKRSIHGTMARTLIRMYRTVTPGEWLYLPDVPQKSRDCTGMAYWGLIEEMQEKRDDGGRVGWWRLTALGIEFVQRQARVPKYVRVYDDRRLGYLGEPVSIIDCLGKRFNYSELMNG